MARILIPPMTKPKKRHLEKKTLPPSPLFPKKNEKIKVTPKTNNAQSIQFRYLHDRCMNHKLHAHKYFHCFNTQTRIFSNYAVPRERNNFPTRCSTLNLGHERHFLHIPINSIQSKLLFSWVMNHRLCTPRD